MAKHAEKEKKRTLCAEKWLARRPPGEERRNGRAPLTVTMRSESNGTPVIGAGENRHLRLHNGSRSAFG